MLTTQETLVHRYYRDALNPGQLAILDELLDNGFIDHERLLQIPPTVDGLKQKYTLLRSGFSDLTFDINDLMVVADRVAVRLTVSGTHNGDFMGRPATGRRFAVASVGMTLVRMPPSSIVGEMPVRITALNTGIFSSTRAPRC